MSAGGAREAAAVPRFEPLGEHGWLLRFDAEDGIAVNARVHALAERLAATRPAAVTDVVPAYASLAVVFASAASASAATAATRAQVRAWIEDALRAPAHAAQPERRDCIEIAVRYGGEHGPDLAALAAHAGLAPEDVVRRHCAPEYRVAMLGFAPGFPYLLGLDPALAMPRLPTPRARVPAGSVGIAEAQTGIYPQASPGGWRLVGRTDAVLFDPARSPPTLLRAGDRVRFRAVR